MTDHGFSNQHMTTALALAREAMAEGEVPVAAIITNAEGEVIAKASNRVERDGDPTAHAEMLAIREAAAQLGQHRLNDCDLWVTLEPCPMCAGAIAHARIRRLYFAASDPKAGAVESGIRFFDSASCHHAPEIYGGLSEAAASAQLRAFFAARR